MNERQCLRVYKNERLIVWREATSKHSHLYAYIRGINYTYTDNSIYIYIYIYVFDIQLIYWICLTDSVFLSVCSESGLYQQYCLGSLEYNTCAKLHRVALGEFWFRHDC